MLSKSSFSSCFYSGGDEEGGGADGGGSDGVGPDDGSSISFLGQL